MLRQEVEAKGEDEKVVAVIVGIWSNGGLPYCGCASSNGSRSYLYKDDAFPNPTDKEMVDFKYKVPDAPRSPATEKLRNLIREDNRSQGIATYHYFQKERHGQVKYWHYYGEVVQISRHEDTAKLTVNKHKKPLATTKEKALAMLNLRKKKGKGTGSLSQGVNILEMI